MGGGDTKKRIQFPFTPMLVRNNRFFVKKNPTYYLFIFFLLDFRSRICTTAYIIRRFRVHAIYIYIHMCVCCINV